MFFCFSYGEGEGGGFFRFFAGFLVMSTRLPNISRPPNKRSPKGASRLPMPPSEAPQRKPGIRMSPAINDTPPRTNSVPSSMALRAVKAMPESS